MRKFFLLEEKGDAKLKIISETFKLNFSFEEYSFESVIFSVKII